MMTINVLNNGTTETLNITANAEMFIVPNTPNRIGEYYSESTKNKIRKLAADNNIQVSDNTRAVETWIVSEDLHSDNLGDHGFCFIINGVRYYGSYLPSLLPENLVADVKEGDSRIITWKNLKAKSNDDTELVFDLTLDVKANQLDYRYRRFGTFEQVLSSFGTAS